MTTHSFTFQHFISKDRPGTIMSVEVEAEAYVDTTGVIDIKMRRIFYGDQNLRPLISIIAPDFITECEAAARTVAVDTWGEQKAVPDEAETNYKQENTW